MTKKSELAASYLDLIQPPQGIPDPPDAGTLLERGMILVLQKHLTAARAAAGVEALRKEYEDWNEARVAQAQEIATFLAPRTGKRSPDKLVKYVPAARDAKAYLQEVFQKTHGLDLEFLRKDPAAGAKVLAQLPMLGQYLGSVLLWVAEEGEQPITIGHIRVLDRLGLITRTTSIKKAREAVAPLVSKPDALRFSVAFGYVADAWCDSRKPICWECQLREVCPTGKKVFKDWTAQQERLSAQRAREHSRKLAQDARDQARQKRETARELKKSEAEKARRARADVRERAKGEASGKKGAKSAAGKAGTKKKTGARKTSPTGSRPTASKATKAAKSTPAKKKTGKRPTASRATGSRPAAASSKAGRKTAKKAPTRKKTGRR